jgi:hypothetical protein
VAATNELIAGLGPVLIFSALKARLSASFTAAEASRNRGSQKSPAPNALPHGGKETFIERDYR